MLQFRLNVSESQTLMSLVSIFVFLLCAVPVFGQDSIEKYEPVPDEIVIEAFSYQRFFTKDKFDRKITFYLSKLGKKDSAPATNLPLVVCIQGSGSQSVFLEVDTPQGKRIASGGPEAVINRDFQDKVRVLVVEKPGVEFLVQPEQPGSAEEGSEEFCREHTLERWTEAVNAALLAAMTLPEIDTTRVLALGHSEGGQVACQVAAANDSVTHVAVMAGGGPTQLFDFINMARAGTFHDSDPDPETRVQQLLTSWKEVLADPDAHDKFFLGHPHRRWTTFLASSPIEAILKTKANVFVAQGTADTNSEPISADVMYAELMARGRDCKYVRIEGGDHAFMLPDDEDGSGWINTNSSAINWFLDDGS